MQTQTSEFPRHPVPNIPQPEQPRGHHAQQQMIYVYERQGWEYKIITEAGSDARLTADHLNALGASGWELVGVVPRPEGVQFYFKRICK
jgi:hypothetical protein